YGDGKNMHVVHGDVLSEGGEKRLARAAQRTRQSPERLLDASLSYFLDQIETDEEVRADAEESFRDYQETWLHLTNEEVMDWLERRANGEDVPLPDAHT